jgi:hypothetical protein
VSVCSTESGSRKALRYVAAPAPGNVRRALRVDFADTAIEVVPDGKACVKQQSDRGRGRRSPADQGGRVTLFDDFGYATGPCRGKDHP